jgi:hypothetical protein
MRVLGRLRSREPSGIAALAVAFLLTHNFSANSCELSGKTISTHFTDCPGESFGVEIQGMASQCWETRQRFAVIGEKVLHYGDAITPEGTVFYIGKRIEITDDKEQMKFLFGRDFPQLSRRAWVTASYSAGQLRLQTEANSYFRDDDALFSKTVNSFVFEIKSDCSSCALSSLVWSLRLTSKAGKQGLKTRQLDKELSCQLRDGVG